jgi:transposase InsO family protein
MNRELTDLVLKIAEANPLWGAPRIHGELLKLGIEVSERTVSRLMPKRRKPPSQTWRAFLNNHVMDLVSIDFFTVPTAAFRVLVVLVVLAHHRRRVIHFNVTEHPTAWWTGQQMVEAFPEDTAPRYVLRDRDKIYGCDFRERIQSMNIEEVLSAPVSPWQRAYVERLIGSIRRDCLDHVIILGERHLRTILKSYLEYYHCSRTHLALAKDTPEPREVQRRELGAVVELPEVGGLHHRYERRAA